MSTAKPFGEFRERRIYECNSVSIGNIDAGHFDTVACVATFEILNHARTPTEFSMTIVNICEVLSQIDEMEAELRLIDGRTELLQVGADG